MVYKERRPDYARDGAGGASTKKKSAEKQKKDQGQEEELNAALEYLLTSHARYLNEGNNGVIFLLELDEALPEVERITQSFRTSGIELVGDQAMKILKIYKPGEAKREFAMQMKAWELMNATPERRALVNIPKPRLYADLRLSSPAKDFLQSQGMSVDTDNVEIIVMDLVHGEDLATRFYREVLKTFEFDPEVVDTMKINELMRWIGIKLNLKSTGLFVDGAMSPEQRKVLNENAERIFMHLVRTGRYKLPPNVIPAIEETMRIFHQNGLVFRDGHFRNFMLETLPDGSTRVHVIDYGHSMMFEGPYNASLYEERGKEYPKDEEITGIMKKYLVEAAAGRSVKTAEEMIDSTRKIIDEFKRKSPLRMLPQLKKFELFIEELKSKKTPIERATSMGYRKIFEPASPPDNIQLKFQAFLTTLDAFYQKQAFSAAEIKRFLEAEKKKGTFDVYAIDAKIGGMIDDAMTYFK